MVDQIREAGGEVFGITSEPQALAVEAEEAWNLNFPIVGDPHHEIRKVCAERDWLDLFYNENAGHLRNRKWTSHPKGYYQPGGSGHSQDRTSALSMEVCSQVQQHGWGWFPTGGDLYIRRDKKQLWERERRSNG